MFKILMLKLGDGHFECKNISAEAKFLFLSFFKKYSYLPKELDVYGSLLMHNIYHL